MAANIFEDFEPPSKKFLATPLRSNKNKIIYSQESYFPLIECGKSSSYKM